MRIALAKSRNITLDKNILAKLMLAEYFNPEFFKAITKVDNREALKDIETEEWRDNGPFSNWKDNEWVKGWLANGTLIGDQKLDYYVYFANNKNRYGQSNLNQLSPSAKKCFDYLTDGTQTHRDNALKLVDSLSPGEKAIIASEIFSQLARSSSLKIEVLRSYADFCIKANLIPEAVAKIMELPVRQFDATAYGQLSTFFTKLSPEELGKLNNYFASNPSLKTSIENQHELMNLIKR